MFGFGSEMLQARMEAQEKGGDYRNCRAIPYRS
jgi:hypothetical protein